MTIDTENIIYQLAIGLRDICFVEFGDVMQNFMKKHVKVSIDKNSKDYISQRIYYKSYALRLINAFITKFGEIVYLELVPYEERQDYDIIFHLKNGTKKYISFDYKNIAVNNIIPEKFPKICKYNKHTNTYKEFIEGYNEIQEIAMNMINKYEKYSDIPYKIELKYIYTPICELVAEYFSNKRKCADNLFKHLFNESDRIVCQLYKKRFSIYDFGKEIEDIGSFKTYIDKEDPRKLIIKFNNDMIFYLTLKTNTVPIRDKLSMKFHVELHNMDDIFSIWNECI